MKQEQLEMLDAMQDALYYFEDLTANLLSRIEVLEDRVRVLSDIAGVESLREKKHKFSRI